MMPSTEAFRCSNESIRLAAVRETKIPLTKEGISFLIHALRDTSWRVRREAVTGLTSRGVEEALPELLRTLCTDHENLGVLSASIQILSQAGVDTLPALTGMFDDANLEVVTSAALVLGAQENPRAASALIGLLRHSNANVRYHAIEALGKLRAGAAVDSLMAVAESRDFFLAFPALEALASIGDSRIANRLVPLLQDDLLSIPALEVLGKVGTEEAIPEIVKLLDDASVPLGAVVKTLADLHAHYDLAYRKGTRVADLVQRAMPPTAVQKLVDAANHSSSSDSQPLAVVLSWFTGPDIEQALMKLLNTPARDVVIETLVRKGSQGVRLIVDSLGSEDLELRQRLVAALGRIGDVQAVPALLQLLDTDEELLPTIAGALGMIADRRSYRPLVGLLAHPNASVRRASVSALNSLGHPDMEAELGTWLRSPNPAMRESAVRIAGYVGYPSCAELLLERCREENENVRRTSIESLSCLEDSRVVPVLNAALQDDVPSVRAAAARALAHVEPGSAWPLFEKALGDEDPWVRYFAVRSLGRLRWDQAQTALTMAALQDQAPQVRVAAVEALGAIGGASLAAILVPVAESAEADLARAALAALGATKSSLALPALLAALNSTEDTRRVEGIHALGQSGLAQAAEPLRKAAMDPDVTNSRAAIDALTHLDVGEAAESLVALTVLPSRRDTCIAALASGHQGRVDLIAKGLRHEQVDVRRAVVDVLARMGSAEAIEALRTALGDADASIRHAAMVALHLADDLPSELRLAAMAENDPDPAVRQTAKARLRG